MGHLLGEIPQSLSPGEILRFPIPWKGREQEMLVFRMPDGSWAAFLNKCCHWSEPLDTDSPAILNGDCTQIRCSIHGARFTLPEGLCVSGPCLLSTLTRFEVQEDDGKLFWMDKP